MTERGHRLRQPRRGISLSNPSIDDAVTLARDYLAALDMGERDNVRRLRQAIATFTVSNDRKISIRRTLQRKFERHPRQSPPCIQGVYLLGGSDLFTGNTSGCYVGLSSNINYRFVSGHQRQGGTRADLLPLADSVFVTPVSTSNLRFAEVLLYILTQAVGLTPVNEVSHLAHVSDRVARPIVACRIRDGRLTFHRGTIEASRALNIYNAIPTVLNRYQNQIAGYTFRLATSEEATLERPVAEPSEVYLVGRELRWSKGGIPAVTRSALRRTNSYTARQATGYFGVTRSDRSPGRWTARLVRPGDPQNNPKEILGRRFLSEYEAYLSREAFLDAHPDFVACNQRGLRPKKRTS